jgi:hypothetical protein
MWIHKRNYLVNFGMHDSDIESSAQSNFGLGIFNQGNNLQYVITKHQSNVFFIASQKE